MRFISKHPGFSITVKHTGEILVSTPSGARLVPNPDEPGLICKFTQGGLAPWEKEIASEHFEVRGLGAGQGAVHRFGFYDTELEQLQKGWTDEFRAEIERILTERADNANFMLIERPRLAPPWPAYDAITVQGRRTIEVLSQQIAEKTVEDGYDLDYVLAYERENANRGEVVAALERAKEAVALGQAGEVEINA